MTVQDDDIIRVTAVMQVHATDDLFNVFHIQSTNEVGVDDSDFAAAVAAWVDAIYTCFLAHVVNSVQFVEILFYNVTQDAPIPAEAWPVLTWGPLAADDLPQGVAALVSLDTATKKVTGRKYFGGFPTSDIGDGGTWVVAVATLMACVLLKMVGQQDESEVYFMPGVWSRAAQLFRPFTSAAFDYVPAYQRRRRPGHGS